MIARSVALCTALSLMIGCASYQSQYTRQRAAPGELVWRYDENELQATRDGKVVAEEGRWDGLGAALACVPEARDRADAATARHRRGTTTMWASAITWIAGTVAGVALLGSDRSGVQDAGAAVALSSLAIGFVGFILGVHWRVTAVPRGIDAVNLYNDRIASGVTCK
jgi:hypothetical protein